MKRWAALAVLVILAASRPLSLHSSPDPSGAYRCDGASPDGRTYRVAVQIVRNGDTYVVKWLTPNGLVNVGVGFVSGDRLSVGYVGTSAGVVVYQLQRKQLTGKWTDISASGRVYTETLTKLADGETIALPRGGPPF